MSDPVDHSNCDRVIAKLEKEVAYYRNFLEYQLEKAPALLPAHEKYARIILEIREFLNKVNGTDK